VLPPLAAVTLPRRIPFHHASDLLLTGRTVNAAEAVGMGLVNRTVPAAGPRGGRTANNAGK